LGLDLQAIINSRIGVGLALGLGRILPPGIGYRFVGQLAGWIAAQRNSNIVKAVRANQWIVGGEKLTSSQLDWAVRATFRNTARCLFDLYHHLNDLETINQKIDFSEVANLFDNRDKEEIKQNGLIIVGIHLSNFDLIMHAAANLGLHAMVLSFADPGESYRWQNDIRRRAGLDMVPASMQSMRQAVKLLKEGGKVLTGIDRPVNGGKIKPLFFDRPAQLPTHHINLALYANVPIVVVATLLQSDGRYHILASESVHMRRFTDHQTEIKYNAEAVLNVAQSFICQAPQQWAMFYPVWPGVEIPE
jgi:lauroyl/myristoyl acyltransferase